jgi:hypothetical protein
VKSLCAEVQRSGQSLQDLARERWPDRAEALAQVFDPRTQLGAAPRDARRFAESARTLG